MAMWFHGVLAGTTVFKVILIEFFSGVGLIAQSYVKKNNDIYQVVFSGSR